MCTNKKRTGRSGIHYEEAVEEALWFGWIDGLLRGIDGEKYARRYSPRRKHSTWSESNKTRVAELIEQGRMTEAGLAKIRQAKESGQWEAAERREALEIPPDLQRALAVNKNAEQCFQELAPWRRKQLIGWAMSAKMKATRDRRISETVRLAEEEGTAGEG